MKNLKHFQEWVTENKTQIEEGFTIRKAELSQHDVRDDGSVERSREDFFVKLPQYIKDYDEFNKIKIRTKINKQNQSTPENVANALKILEINKDKLHELTNVEDIYTQAKKLFRTRVLMFHPDKIAKIKDEKDIPLTIATEIEKRASLDEKTNKKMLTLDQKKEIALKIFTEKTIALTESIELIKKWEKEYASSKDKGASQVLLVKKHFYSPQGNVTLVSDQTEEDPSYTFIKNIKRSVDDFVNKNEQKELTTLLSEKFRPKSLNDEPDNYALILLALEESYRNIQNHPVFQSNSQYSQFLQKQYMQALECYCNYYQTNLSRRDENRITTIVIPVINSNLLKDHGTNHEAKVIELLSRIYPKENIRTKFIEKYKEDEKLSPPASSDKVSTSTATLFAQPSSDSKSQPVRISKEEGRIQDQIALLDKEINSYWPYPNKDRKKIKKFVLQKILEEHKTYDWKQSIENVKTKYMTSWKEALLGTLSKRTAALIQHLETLDEKREPDEATHLLEGQSTRVVPVAVSEEKSEDTTPKPKAPGLTSSGADGVD